MAALDAGIPPAASDNLEFSSASPPWPRDKPRGRACVCNDVDVNLSQALGESLGVRTDRHGFEDFHRRWPVNECPRQVNCNATRDKTPKLVVDISSFRPKDTDSRPPARIDTLWCSLVPFYALESFD